MPKSQQLPRADGHGTVQIGRQHVQRSAVLKHPRAPFLAGGHGRAAQECALRAVFLLPQRVSLGSSSPATNLGALRPHRFVEVEGTGIHAAALVGASIRNATPRFSMPVASACFVASPATPRCPLSLSGTPLYRTHRSGLFVQCRAVVFAAST